MINQLVGKKIKSVDVDDDEVIIICECGRAFRFYHLQECCEYVRIHTILGDPQSLVGKIIDSVNENNDEYDSKFPYPDIGYTWTQYRINDVTFVWLGTSNGFYSEKVYLEYTHVPIPLTPADRVYVGNDVKVEWRPGLCTKCGNCHSQLPKVFDPNRRPWVDVNAAGFDEVMRVVNECPSGALSGELT